jgi:hypothetical protein
MDATQIAKTGFKLEMQHKGFKAQLMRAQRLKDIGRAHGLPPGVAIPIWPIESLPGVPSSWINEAGSYVCPVSTNYGLWFDWTMNDGLNTAVVPSVKGMNPITGLKITEPRLEQYLEKCPKHNIAFKDELYCPKCKYKWPTQSYVANPNVLWWDGFRQANGTVRQFFFTDKDERDIASIMIGKQNVVPAFGFMFFQPKQRREYPKVNMLRGDDLIKTQGFYGWTADDHPNLGCAPGGMSGGMSAGGNQHIGVPMAYYHADSLSYQSEEKTAAPILASMNTSAPRSRSIQNRLDNPIASIRDVSVGAGAEINQSLQRDPLKIEDWKDEPAAIIRLYFVFERQFQDIVNKGGILDLEGDREGYLKNLPVG